MSHLFFFNGSFAAIFVMSVVRMLATGRIDAQYGFAGSLLNALTSSFVAALLSALAFGLTSVLMRRVPGRQTSLKLGAAAGVAGCFVAWTWMRLGRPGPFGIFACFMACAVVAALVWRAKRLPPRT
ncbi:MAG: hypothetical protein H7332_16635 [Bdellovibrionales bacterium]|nr:hypothetical protein [Ramlibacter sp.]